MMVLRVHDFLFLFFFFSELKVVGRQVTSPQWYPSVMTVCELTGPTSRVFVDLTLGGSKHKPVDDWKGAKQQIDIITNKTKVDEFTPDQQNHLW